MKIPKKFLEFDFRIQVLFVAFIPVILSLTFFNSSFFLLMLILWFIVGLWQVISALILTLGYGIESRKKYLLFVAIYFLALYISISVLSFSINIPGILLLVMSIPVAIWYGYMTYKDKNRVPKSFWDLEF